MGSIITSVFDSLFSFNWRGLYEVVRAIIIVIDVLLVVGIVFAIVKGFSYRPKFYSNPKKVKKKEIVRDPEIIKQWARVIERARANPPQSYMLGIIEADKLVDDVLKKIGLMGETMAERLEKLNSSNMKTLEKLWRVHRVRNELVHNPEFNLSRLDANDILKTYYDFLKELEVI